MRKSLGTLFLAATTSLATAPAMAQSCNPMTVVNGAMQAVQQAQGMGPFQSKILLHNYNSQAVAGTVHPILCRIALAGLEEKALHSSDMQNLVTSMKLGVVLSRNPDVAAVARSCCPG